MQDELVTLEEHIIQQRGLPHRLPQDKIYYGKQLIGYIGTQKDAGICLIVTGLPDSIKNQIKLVVAERDAELFGEPKEKTFQRKVSQPPKPLPTESE